jgi:hypothetical protein
MDKFARGETETSEFAINVLSATLLAVTVTLVAEDTLGAVNRPVPVMVPPLACHATAVLLVEVMVAENCICAPEATLALVGARLSWTAGLFVEGLGEADDTPAHPRLRPVATVRRKVARTRSSRRAVLLVWKPGDDSKNMFALTD